MPLNESEMRVVVDAQIVLSMFLIRRDRHGVGSPKRRLLTLLAKPEFRWLWTADIIGDYERGADAIATNDRLRKHTDFDHMGFQLMLAALQLFSPVAVSAGTLRNARRRISQASRLADCDLEDAIYLACAVDGDADLLATEDSDLRSLGSTYESVRIVSWQELNEELSKRGLSLD